MFWQPNRRPPVPTPPLEVVHAGVSYKVAVKRVGAARRFTLRVRAATQDAVLTMPPRASMRTALKFAERHAEWIGTRLSSLPGYIRLGPGVVVPVRGVDHVIVHDPAPRGRALAEISGSGHIKVSGDAPAIGRHIVATLRKEAARDFEAACRRHCGTIGKSFARISIRDTRSRWGSCSARGTLSFFLAARHGASLRARLSRGTRSRASVPYGPFGRLLGRDAAACSADRRRRGLAQTARAGAASLCGGLISIAG